MTNRLFCIITLTTLFLSCDSESCKIDFSENVESYEQAVIEIHSLNLKKDSKEPYFRITKSFTESTSPIRINVFEEIEFVECHEDGTIIFQAPDCDKESGLRNVVYFLAYSPNGKSHVKRKRNIGDINEIKANWFLGKHVNSLAN